MEHITLEQVISKLEKDLSHIESGKESAIIKAESSAGLCRHVLDEFRRKVTEQDFITEEEEINFFKHIKPVVLSKYIYYVQLIEIESQRYNALPQYQVKYLNQSLAVLHRYLRDKTEFCRYYHGGKTYLDKLYFLRENSHKKLNPENICILMDSKFSTARDAMAASVLAYEQLIKYIGRELRQLHAESIPAEESIARSTANWTESGASLVELLYALQSSGAVNNGNIGLSDLAQIFESVFNIKFDDYYRTYTDIRNRKKSRTLFLDKLKQDLLRRMEEADK